MIGFFEVTLDGVGIKPHDHMLNDQPRLFVMHFWANDDVNKLANGLKAVLTNVNTAKQ